jgi:hypothetical protein
MPRAIFFISLIIFAFHGFIPPHITISFFMLPADCFLPAGMSASQAPAY